MVSAGRLQGALQNQAARQHGPDDNETSSTQVGLEERPRKTWSGVNIRVHTFDSSVNTISMLHVSTWVRHWPDRMRLSWLARLADLEDFGRTDKGSCSFL